MHMADALISPAVGATMWAATAGLIAYSAHKVQEVLNDRIVPLMGVLGAFIFAAQMINFSIPATGSSGHLGGGMILSILLGPYAAFLVMASVLTVQALFFADGGLLALGCNIFNLGFFPCFIAYPLIFRRITGTAPAPSRLGVAAILAAIVSLQLGAFGVVLETVFSGISELPFRTFVLLMQPIHLAIGIVEGLVTAAVVAFVWRARPEIVNAAGAFQPMVKVNIKKVLFGLLLVAVITGGALSWFASSHPDGLEWAMLKTSGKEELESATRVHAALSSIQAQTAFLPDYAFKQDAMRPGMAETVPVEDQPADKPAWPAVAPGTSVSGLVGGAVTLALALFIGIALKRPKVEV
ncbi:MAG TPA: energy-coupling factor ABC transporter permease [Candidatus Omnitrophota bacterium]|nr:energy-coupling factor ABC transporter permease [Candidatus Omnitrophota bacterium]